MHWDQFASGLKQFIAKVASPQILGPEEDDAASEDALLGAAFGNDEYGEEQMTPYSPDGRSERCESSLHLSC